MTEFVARRKARRIVDENGEEAYAYVSAVIDRARNSMAEGFWTMVGEYVKEIMEEEQQM